MLGRSKNRVIAGMLSVNGYGANVWRPNWQGTFIPMEPVHE